MEKFCDVIHALIMVMVQATFEGVNIFCKVAVDDGMSLKVLVAYCFIFASAFIVPIAFFVERNKRPKMTWMILLQGTLCGLFGGVLSHNLYVSSLVLTSTTFASAMVNLIPAITFVMAICRLESLPIKSITGKFKALGTILGIGGAMFLTFYRDGHIPPSSSSSSHSGHRVLGSLLEIGSYISYPIWLIIQKNLSKRYSCRYSGAALMGALLGSLYAFCTENDWNQWKLGLTIRLLSVSYSGIVASGVMMLAEQVSRNVLIDASNETYTKYGVDISSIKQAHERIKNFVHRTPVLSSETLNVLAGRRLSFKCECFQKGGAFKFRGACNAVFSLNAEQAAKGVVTHSSGNHAAALSLAAKVRGIPAYVVVPENAPNCKVQNVMRYGGKVIKSEASMQSRKDTANTILQETHGVLVPSSNDKHVISGQGTIALELLEQVPQIDTLIVPISGGGMISGVALAAKSINPAIRVLAAEPKGANDAALSKKANEIVTLPETNTIADGLRAFLGDITWPVVRDLVDDVITVDDTEIVEAMKLCYEILKVAVEPSGAIGLAAVLSSSFRNNPAWKDCKEIGIVLSGGNVDLGILWNSLKKN